MGPIASSGALDRERNCVKPVGLDCARHVRERWEGDFLAGRAFESTDEVRVVETLGSDAETARAESANCNAGDGTAELRQVLAGEAALPEPLLSSGVIGAGRLSIVVDGNLDFAREVFMRQHGRAGALTGELKERDEISAEPLIFPIGSSMSAAYIVNEVKASQGLSKSFVSPEPGPTRILDDHIAVVLPGGADENITCCEKPLILARFFRVIGARVVGD